MTPTIGEPRVYPGEEVPVLYPGEVASAHVHPAALLEALERGEREVPIQNWIVEPMPGWRGWWLRTRYRVWGRWFARGAPQITTHVDVREGARR
jgi:hypothetical protein